MKLYALFQMIGLMIYSRLQLIQCHEKGTIHDHFTLFNDCSASLTLLLTALLVDFDAAAVVDGEYIVVFKQDSEDHESNSLQLLCNPVTLTVEIYICLLH